MEKGPKWWRIRVSEQKWRCEKSSKMIFTIDGFFVYYLKIINTLEFLVKL